MPPCPAKLTTKFYWLSVPFFSPFFSVPHPVLEHVNKRKNPALIRQTLQPYWGPWQGNIVSQTYSPPDLCHILLFPKLATPSLCVYLEAYWGLYYNNPCCHFLLPSTLANSQQMCYFLYYWETRNNKTLHSHLSVPFQINCICTPLSWKMPSPPQSRGSWTHPLLPAEDKHSPPTLNPWYYIQLLA